MISFKDMLLESKAGKNLHLEHLEDEIINFGVDGGRAAINFLRSLRDMLAGANRSSVNMTVSGTALQLFSVVLTLMMINSLSQRKACSMSILNFTKQSKRLMTICLAH